MSTNPRGAMLCAGCIEPVALAEASCPGCGQDPLLHERYALLQVLGRGAAGTTYKARSLQTGQLVALKELPLRPGDPPKRRELFHREASILRQLHHPAIPRYVDDFEAGKGKARALYLAQEYIEGIDLQREMEGHRYSSIEVLDLIDELLGVLSYLHALAPPVIHRDLKPANVIRRASDHRLVLVDFGAVRDALVDDEVGSHTVAGTFGYMAPEQFRGDASTGTDLYGLGALAVKLLTRREPHTMLTPSGQLDWARHTRVEPAMAALLRALLAPDPRQRPSSAVEVRRWVGSVRRTPNRVPILPVPVSRREETALARPSAIHGPPQAPAHALSAAAALDPVPVVSVAVGLATGLGLLGMLLMMVFTALGLMLI